MLDICILSYCASFRMYLLDFVVGFGNVQANINEDGLRWSTAHGYLRPAMTRDNLHVAVKSQVRQVQ